MRSYALNVMLLPYDLLGIYGRKKVGSTRQQQKAKSCFFYGAHEAKVAFTQAF